MQCYTENNIKTCISKNSHAVLKLLFHFLINPCYPKSVLQHQTCISENSHAMLSENCQCCLPSPSRVWMSFPVVMSKTLTMPSSAPDAMYLPSGLCKAQTANRNAVSRSVCQPVISSILPIKISMYQNKNQQSVRHAVFWLVLKTQMQQRQNVWCGCLCIFVCTHPHPATPTHPHIKQTRT